MELLHLSDENFKQNVLDKKGVVVVDFFATWCGPCRMLSPVLEQVQEEMEGKITIVKLDVDEGENTAKQYGIMSVPSMVVFKDGEEIDRLVGFKSKDALVEYFSKLY